MKSIYIIIITPNTHGHLTQFNHNELNNKLRCLINKIVYRMNAKLTPPVEMLDCLNTKYFFPYHHPPKLLISKYQWSYIQYLFIKINSQLILCVDLFLKIVLIMFIWSKWEMWEKCFFLQYSSWFLILSWKKTDPLSLLQLHSKNVYCVAYCSSKIG